MAEEKEMKTETAEKHDKKELSMRYLAALIQYADWVPEDYKKLMTKNSPVELLKELYLCACDNVPLKKVQEAQNGKDSVNALRKVRYEYLRELVEKGYEQELKELRKRITTAEAKIVEQEHKLQNVPKFGTVHQEEKIQSHVSEKVSEEKNSLFIHNQKRGYFRRRSKSPVVFLSEIVDTYSTEQLQFIMDCIEEGISVQDIRAFISPVLPVEVMQRLKKIEQNQGGKKNGSR